MDPVERDEALAMRLIANGVGSHRLPGHPFYDEAVVSFPLGTLDEALVYLRRNHKTRRTFHFGIHPAAKAARLPPGVPGAEEEIPPRDVRRVIAERFLCDTLEVLEGHPGGLQRSILKKALDHLVATGQFERDDARLLAPLVRAWPASAGFQREDAKARRRR